MNGLLYSILIAYPTIAVIVFILCIFAQGDKERPDVGLCLGYGVLWGWHFLVILWNGIVRSIKQHPLQSWRQS